LLDEPATQGASKQWSQVMEEAAHNKPHLPPELKGWGPPAQQFYPDCRRHTPGEVSSSGGRGGAGRTTSFSDLRLAQAMARLRGGCARVRAIHPSSSSRVSRLEEPGHESWAGEGWAPPGGSRVRVRLRRPMGSCSRVRVRSLCPAVTARP